MGIGFIRQNFVFLVMDERPPEGLHQVRKRSSMVGNSTTVLDAQQFFKSTFNALINEDYSISADIDRYQDVVEHALLKTDFFNGYLYDPK